MGYFLGGVGGGSVPGVGGVFVIPEGGPYLGGRGGCMRGAPREEVGAPSWCCSVLLEREMEGGRRGMEVCAGVSAHAPGGAVADDHSFSNAIQSGGISLFLSLSPSLSRIPGGCSEYRGFPRFSSGIRQISS